MKKACAVVGIMLICVALFSFVSFAAEDKVVNVDVTPASITLRGWRTAWNNRVFLESVSGQSLSVYPSGENIGAIRLDLRFDNSLSSYIDRDDFNYLFFEFHCDVNSETLLPDDYNFVPFLNFEHFTIYNDYTYDGGGTALLSSSDSSDYVLYFGFQDGEEYRINDKSTFLNWLLRQNGYADYSVYVAVNRGVVSSDIFAAGHAISFFWTGTVKTSYIGIKPIIRLSYGYTVNDLGDVVNQLDTLMNGDTELQNQNGVVSSDHEHLDNQISDINSFFDSYMTDGFAPFMPSVGDYVPNFLIQLWNGFFSGTSLPTRILLAFAACGMFTTVCFWLLRA